MKIKSKYIKYSILVLFTIILFNLPIHSLIFFNEKNLSANTTTDIKPHIPSDLKIEDSYIEVSEEKDSSLSKNHTKKLKTTVIEYIQNGLDKFISDRANPIAGALVIDVKTGNILAFSQGRSPNKWGAGTHTLLHNYFPAASLFKTVVTSAVLDIYDLNPDKLLGLSHGCGTVQPTGVWLIDEVSSSKRAISLRKAYANSCNAFFAKLALNTVGVDAITLYAQKYGWNKTIDADFYVEPSLFNPPQASGSSIHSVGRYAAGFGLVNLSPVHAAWQTLAIANDGVSIPIKFFQDSKLNKNVGTRIVSKQTAIKIRDIMNSTVNGGTASFAFKRGKYRALRSEVGGKTGTLSGKNPEGITTWFVGMMPLSKPEIVVVSVVILEDLWHMKAPNLAAEAFSLWKEYKKQQESMLSSKENYSDSDKALIQTN